jgi:hypothetical protein
MCTGTVILLGRALTYSGMLLGNILLRLLHLGRIMVARISIECRRDEEAGRLAVIHDIGMTRRPYHAIRMNPFHSICPDMVNTATNDDLQSSGTIRCSAMCRADSAHKTTDNP